MTPKTPSSLGAIEKHTGRGRKERVENESNVFCMSTTNSRIIILVTFMNVIYLFIYF